VRFENGLQSLFYDLGHWYAFENGSNEMKTFVYNSVDFGQIKENMAPIKCTQIL
jgi:hypothetical protein